MAAYRDMSVIIFDGSPGKRHEGSLACDLCHGIVPFFFYPHDSPQTVGQMLILTHFRPGAGFDPCPAEAIPDDLFFSVKWHDLRDELPARWHINLSKRTSSRIN